MKLEVVPVPFYDIDVARELYTQRIGWTADHDFRPSKDYGADVPDSVRVVQLTPPGSACSIFLVCDNPVFDLHPGSLRGVHLVVHDIHEARDELLGNGVDVSEINDLSGILYAAFSDPAGNIWTLQQIPRR